MTDLMTRLAARGLGVERALQPRQRAQFEPVTDRPVRDRDPFEAVSGRDDDGLTEQHDLIDRASSSELVGRPRSERRPIMALSHQPSSPRVARQADLPEETDRPAGPWTPTVARPPEAPRTRPASRLRNAPTPEPRAEQDLRTSPMPAARPAPPPALAPPTVTRSDVARRLPESAAPEPVLGRARPRPLVNAAPPTEPPLARVAAEVIGNVRPPAPRSRLDEDADRLEPAPTRGPARRPVPAQAENRSPSLSQASAVTPVRRREPLPPLLPRQGDLLKPREGTPSPERPRALPTGRRSLAPPAPTVQVTIGRIEVRAARAIPSPSAVPQSRPAPTTALSLDEYLARRGECGS